MSPKALNGAKSRVEEEYEIFDESFSIFLRFVGGAPRSWAVAKPMIVEAGILEVWTDA